MSENVKMSRKSKLTPFQVLQQRVAEIHWRWKVWKQLFTGDTETRSTNYELMNKWGPSVFAMLKDAILQDVVVRICRLADPEFLDIKHSNRRRNLSLASAVSDASRFHGSTAQQYAMRLFDDFQERAKNLANWRNRHWVHEDHRTAMGIDQLPTLRFDQIEECISAAAKLLEMLDPSLAEFGYDLMISRGEGESLLYALRCASQYHKECIEQNRPIKC